MNLSININKNKFIIFLIVVFIILYNKKFIRKF